MDIQRARLLRAIRDQNKAMSAASREIGRNHAYVSQFLNNGTPKELAEKDRVGLEKFLDLEDGWLRNPQAPLSAKPPSQNKAQPSNEGLTPMAQSGREGDKKEDAVDALSIGVERLLEDYGYKVVAKKLDELEAQRRANPHERRRA